MPVPIHQRRSRFGRPGDLLITIVIITVCTFAQFYRRTSISCFLLKQNEFIFVTRTQKFVVRNNIVDTEQINAERLHIQIGKTKLHSFVALFLGVVNAEKRKI